MKSKKLQNENPQTSSETQTTYKNRHVITKAGKDSLTPDQVCKIQDGNRHL
jgi:hypothetical protein